MSGFEVVGIVLGAIPVAVTMLEKHIKIVHTVQRWRRYERDLKALVRSLQTDKVRLENICEKLLTGIVPPSVIDTMVADPGGDLWKEVSTQKRIRARLWNYDRFDDSLEELQAAIEEICRRLEPDDMENIKSGKWINGLFSVQQFRRASLVFSRASYDDVLKVISDDITRLESLIDTSIKLEPNRLARSRARFVPLLRQMVASVFRTISSSLVCPCQHDVSLRLTGWSADIVPQDQEEQATKDISLHLAVLSSPPSQAQGSTIDTANRPAWEEISVKHYDDISEKSTVTMCLDNAISNAVGQPLSKKKGKGSRFERPKISFFSASTATTTETLANALVNIPVFTTSIALSKFGLAPSLCQGLMGSSNATHVQSEWRLVLHDNLPSQTRASPAYQVYSNRLLFPDHVATSSPPEFISLHQVLESTDPPGTCPMEYRQRLQIAALVASSVLQLSNMTCLPAANIPDSKNIFFARKSNETLYEHAFMKVSSEGHAATTSRPDRLIQNPTLMGLGIVLIELIKGRTIDSLRQPEEAAQADAERRDLLVDCATARRFLNEVEQASSNYGSAVRRCIEVFQRRVARLDSVDFIQEVYSGVVELLEEDSRNAC